MVRCWSLVVVDFQHLYGLNLRDEYATRPWSWFRPLALGLLLLPESLLRVAMQARAAELEEAGI